MNEIYYGLEKVHYEGSRSKNRFAFHDYNPDEIILGRKMREYLKFAISYWHTFCATGVDMFGTGTMDKTFGATDSLEVAYKKADACFELMEKLSVDYYCFHDRDIAPEGTSLE